MHVLTIYIDCFLQNHLLSLKSKWSFQNQSTNEVVEVKELTTVEKVDLKRYMISMVYAEQLTNAFIHYNEFLSLATRWNFTGVEPFVLNSRMSGFQNSDSYDIRELLDMKLFHRRYAECVGGNNKV